MEAEAKAIDLEARQKQVAEILATPAIQNPAHALTATHQRKPRSDKGKPKPVKAQTPFMVGPAYAKFDLSQDAGYGAFEAWFEGADKGDVQKIVNDLIDEVNRLRAQLAKRGAE